VAGAVQTRAYRDLLKALIRERERHGHSQADLARKLDRPPSFVGKYELGERRLDVVEVFVILTALECDPLIFLEKNLKHFPKNL
jgi:transcriptional regulator with XRE-family HTH domain